ncbi:MAG: 50S ribosomal protein L29 [Pseudomonadota bacterium]|nr:50S ribosomal protein L29 [Pseudomonadota bacterium]
MKISELASLGDEELVHKELELERTMMAQTFRHRLGQLENTSVLKNTRRDIARTQTLLVAREREGSLQRGSLKARHRSSFTPIRGAAAAAGAGDDFLKGILDSRESVD